MTPLHEIIHALLDMLQDGRISLAEYERRINERLDRQTSLELGVGASTEVRQA